jgi:LCP family protein required for cell wall assembly
VALLSLPRDLIVEIPGYGQARINAANVYGEQFSHSGGGIELARLTVSNLLDIPIDYVVEVNFQGFIGAIDAIGGVTIDVEQELYDPLYPTMDYGYTVAHFEPGEQHMGGERALMYSRIRHMDSDFERMHRQQAVMLAVLERVRQQNAAQQVQTIADLTTALRDYIQTDMPPRRMVSLAWTLRDMQPDMVERYTLDETMVTMNVIPDDPYATFALPGTIDSLVGQLMGASSQ